MVVPVGAVLDVGGGKAVFVREGEETFRLVPVEPGVSNGEVVAIREGLAEGQTVVVGNAAMLKSHLEMTAEE